MKLSKIILFTVLTGTIINAQEPSPVSYRYENFLWHNDRRLYWPDSSEIHRICWNNDFYNSSPSTKADCQIMIHYISAVQASVYNQEKREELQAELTKNKEKLATIKACQNDGNNSNKTIIDAQQTIATKLLLQEIQDNEKALAAVPKDIVPINFPTYGMQHDKDTFKNAIVNLLPHWHSKEKIIEEIAQIKSVLERARNRKLYESK